jgi:NADH-quinone oxidoreductase subunit H
MAEEWDQIFVTSKHALLSAVPFGYRSLFSLIISIVALLVVFPSFFAFTTWLERKGLGRLQNRLGPNRVGPFGLLQPLADGLKAMTKEDLVPDVADRVVHFIAPLVLVVPAFLAISVVPFGRNMTALDMDGGLLFFFAAGSATELSVFMAGWSSRNKYALLGAMRAIAQIISYELPLILSAISVVMMTGTLSTVRIVEGQAGYHFGVPNWFMFTPWGFAGLLLFLIAGAAESNRSPFDLPEGESEIIAGYYVEYSGFKFALFFLGEYIGLFAILGMAVTLFMGGWQSPLSILTWVPSFFWFVGKLFCLMALFIWIRGTLPRLRIDQLMNFAWKFMLPMALVTLVSAACWHFMVPGVLRWLGCFLLIGCPYLLLGKTLIQNQMIGPRTYRYGD